MILTHSLIPWFIYSILIVIITYLYIQLRRSKQFKQPLQKTDISADQALQMLIEGNNEYIKSGTLEFDRKLVMQTQHPIAIILSCSDSRVSPELIFNQLHANSLFIIRNAGNIVGNTVLGSIEFGVKYLHAPLIIVLGHERCGAITAAVDATLENKKDSSSAHIQSIINIIKPVVDRTINDMTLQNPSSTDCKNTIIKKAAFENIHHVIHQISQESKIVSKALDEKKIKIIGAYYDLDYGSLEFID